VFGGNGLAVTRYSLNPKAAVAVVRYLISSDEQRKRSVDTASIPSRTALLRDPNLLQNTGFHGWMSEHWREGMFARPSVETGTRYSAISRAYSKAVHNVISGKEDAHEALTRLKAQLVTIMQSPIGPSTK
jgi:trehalose/maltose transport system substrate-binding protein